MDDIDRQEPVPAAALHGPQEMEVLALVCPDARPSLTRPAGHEMVDDVHMHMNELQARRESLKFVLSRTAKNLDYFNDQCKSNPSCEVEGLARFHQDRLMQVQVELKAVRQDIKKLHRAKLQPLRARRQRRGVKSTSPVVNLLDRQLYSDMIFPLIAATDGERARLLPQVCKCWRDCFLNTKVNWDTFSVTQPVHSLCKLGNVLEGAYRLRSLHLVFEPGGGHIESPQALRTLLGALSRLEDLSLAAPGLSLQASNLSSMPTSITTLRIDGSPELGVGVSRTLAARLPALRSLHLLDTPNFSDEALMAWRWKTSLEELALSGCRSLRGSAVRDMCTHCTGLKALHFSRSPVRALHMEATSTLTQLEILSISSCTRADTTPVLGVVRNCRNLKSLQLFDVGPLHDDGLQRVLEAQPYLTSLILGQCPHLTEVLIAAIVAKLPHLTRLALSGCSLLTDGALICVAEGLPNLKHLLLTESAGFSDAGILALEGLTQLQELSLHPLHQASAGGLFALCDCCDQLEYLLLAHCPPVGEDEILQMLRCCMRLRMLMMTHVSLPGEDGIARLLECSNTLQCLVLLPPPSSADCSSMLASPSAWRVHSNFPDAVVISEWEDFDVMLDVCVPGLQEQELEYQVDVPEGLSPGAPFNCTIAGTQMALVCPPDPDAGTSIKVTVPLSNAGGYMADMRHSVLHGLFTGGRQSYSTSEDASLTARRLVQYLLRQTRPRESRGLGGGTSNAKRVRLLRAALDAELHLEEMHGHSRVLLEAGTELEALDACESAARDSKHTLGRMRPAEVARRSRRNADLVPLIASATSPAGSGSAAAGNSSGSVAAGAPPAMATMVAQTQPPTQGSSPAPTQGPGLSGSRSSGGSGGVTAGETGITRGLGGAMIGRVGEGGGMGAGGGGSGVTEFRQRDRGKGPKLKAPASSRVAAAAGACSSRTRLSGGCSSSASTLVRGSGNIGVGGDGVDEVQGGTSAVGPCPSGLGRALPESNCDSQTSMAQGNGAGAAAVGASEKSCESGGSREAGLSSTDPAAHTSEHAGEQSIIDEVSQERPEEWPLQRFQRLFPERMSARLVSTARGRRASESVLCQSILNNYYRLLQESEQAQATHAGAGGVPMLTGAAAGAAAGQDANPDPDTGGGTSNDTPLMAGVPGVPQAGGAAGIGMLHQAMVSPHLVAQMAQMAGEAGETSLNGGMPVEDTTGAAGMLVDGEEWVQNGDDDGMPGDPLLIGEEDMALL